MDANGGWEQPKMGIFGRKTGKGAGKQEETGISSCFPEHFLFSCFGFSGLAGLIHPRGKPVGVLGGGGGRREGNLNIQYSNSMFNFQVDGY
jgi:hypothetical protein